MVNIITGLNVVSNDRWLSIAIFLPKTAYLFIYLFICLFVRLFVDLLVLSKMWKRNEYEDGLLRRYLQQGAEVPG